jgi:hypothetical protein
MLNIVGFLATAGECPSTVALVSLMHRPQGVRVTLIKSAENFGRLVRNSILLLSVSVLVYSLESNTDVMFVCFVQMQMRQTSSQCCNVRPATTSSFGMLSLPESCRKHALQKARCHSLCSCAFIHTRCLLLYFATNSASSSLANIFCFFHLQCSATMQKLSLPGKLLHARDAQIGKIKLRQSRQKTRLRCVWSSSALCLAKTKQNVWANWLVTWFSCSDVGAM